MELNEKVRVLERMLREVSGRLDAKCKGDNLTISRIREELDMITIKRKEDRVIMTGIASNETMPVDQEMKKQWLNKIVCGIFNSIDSIDSGKILFINHGRKMGNEIPMLEVRLEKPESAIRRAFVAAV